METSTSSPALTLCRLLGSPLPQLPPTDLPYPWSVLLRAVQQAPSPPARLHAIRAALKHIPSQSLDTLQHDLVAVVLQGIPVPLTAQQRAVLAAVLRLGPSRLAVISRAIQQDRSNTHRRLQALVSKRLLTRTYRDLSVNYSFPIPPHFSLTDNNLQQPTTTDNAITLP